MAPQKKAVAAAAPVIDPADRLSQLHPDLQAHILSFLPAQEAVRTCVLARTWRDREVWKLTRRLLITGDEGVFVQDVGGFVDRGFVDRLLALRLAGLKDHGPIHACEISSFWWVDEDDDIDIIHAIERWIRLALQCHVQSLVVRSGCIPMRDMPLVSRHLTTLELRGILFEPSHTDSCLDFSGCPALQHLEITACNLSNVSKVTSPSVKRLVIITEFNYSEVDLLQICFPHLVSLCLDTPHDYYNLVLESMPHLEVADVKIGNKPCGYTLDDEEENTKCLVLQGLAEAKHLVLLSDDETVTFKRDLRLCPTYSKLKTLVLNHCWCESADCSALACMLLHAPVLEKLTVLFSDYRVEQPKFDMVVEGRPDASGISAMISRHLKAVELKCSEVNQRVVNVLNFLGTLNIYARSLEGSKKRNISRLRDTYFDEVPVVLVLGMLFISEVKLLVSYVFSNWVKVALVCSYVKHTAYWRQCPAVWKCIAFILDPDRCKLFFSKTCLARRRKLKQKLPWSNHGMAAEMKQCSLLPRRVLAGLPNKRSIKVPEQVKKAILEVLNKSLAAADPANDQYIRPPSPPTTASEEPDDVASSILAWHVATSILDLMSHVASSIRRLPPDDDRVTATALSRYCAYLVAERPELLPVDAEWCKKLYKNAKEEAGSVLRSRKKDSLIDSLKESSNSSTVLRVGATLAEELLKEDSSMRWQKLSRFWSEMILYIAPSESLDAHAEAIARGGELITLLWALLLQAGIVDRLPLPADTTADASFSDNP